MMYKTTTHFAACEIARTEGIWRPADEGAHLQLEVQEAAGPVHGALLLRWLLLLWLQGECKVQVK